MVLPSNKKRIHLKKVLIPFLAVVFLGFIVTLVAKSLVMILIHHQYYQQYSSVTQTLTQTYQDLLPHHVSPSKSLLDNANRTVFQQEKNRFPNLIIHYTTNHTPMSVMTTQDIPKKLLTLLHREAQSNLAQEKPYFISPLTKFIFVRMDALQPSLSSYAVFFDKSYPQKSLFVTTSFYGTYLLVTLLLVPLFFRRQQAITRPSIGTAISKKVERTSVSLFEFDRLLIQEALSVIQSLKSHSFLKGSSLAGQLHNLNQSVRPHAFLIEYKALFDKAIETLPLLKSVYQYTYQLKKASELTHIFLSLLKTLLPSIQRVNLYRWNETKQCFYLMSSYHNEDIGYHSDSLYTKAFLYPEVADQGYAALQGKPIFQADEQFLNISLPFRERSESPLLLQLRLMDKDAYSHLHLTFLLRILLRYFSEMDFTFKQLRHASYHSHTPLLNENALRDTLQKVRKRLHTPKSCLHFALIEVIPKQDDDVHDPTLLEVVQKHCVPFVLPYRDIDVNVYCLKPPTLALLISRTPSNDNELSDLIADLLRHFSKKSISFFKQEIPLHMNVGIAKLPYHQASEDALFKEASRDLLAYKKFRHRIHPKQTHNASQSPLEDIPSPSVLPLT